MRRQAEFAGVRRKGRSTAGRFLVLATLRDELLSDFKFGFVTSRRVGNAVERNCVRRRLRAIVQREGGELVRGHFIVSIARRGAAEASYDELHREWKALAQKIGILSLERKNGPAEEE